MSHDEDEKKATEQLLSGFDRPGRTPRSPRVRARDFVDHYSGKSAAVPDPLAPPPASTRNASGSHDRATVLVPRRNNVRAVMTWVVAVAGMILFGATIAVLSTPQTTGSSTTPAPPPSTASLPPITPTSATTITSASPAEPQQAETAQDPVATPPPPSQAAPAKKTAPATTITSGATSAPPLKTAPREDFIRDL